MENGPRFKAVSTQRVALMGVETKPGAMGTSGSMKCNRANVGYPLNAENHTLVLDTNARVKGALKGSPATRTNPRGCSRREVAHCGSG